MLGDWFVLCWGDDVSGGEEYCYVSGEEDVFYEFCWLDVFFGLVCWEGFFLCGGLYFSVYLYWWCG